MFSVPKRKKKKKKKRIEKMGNRSAVRFASKNRILVQERGLCALTSISKANENFVKFVN